MTDRVEELQRLDARHVWHPYAPIPPGSPPICSTARTVRGSAGGRSTAGGWNVELVGGNSRLSASCARCCVGRPARPNGARHARGSDPRASGSPRRAAGRHISGRAGARLLLRLGIGGGRGCRQDGRSVLAGGWTASEEPATRCARRLSRRHVHGDVRRRSPSVGDAPPVQRGPSAAGLRGLPRPVSRVLSTRVGGGRPSCW